MDDKPLLLLLLLLLLFRISAELLPRHRGEGYRDNDKTDQQDIHIRIYFRKFQKKYIYTDLKKVSISQKRCDFRTTELISHEAKVLLHLMKRRITPIIERQLVGSQIGFRKGECTKVCNFSNK
jgi:hypothetical protein